MNSEEKNTTYRITYEHRHGTNIIDVRLPDWPSNEEVEVYLTVEHGYDAEDPDEHFDVDLASEPVSEQEFRATIKEAGGTKR